MGDGKKILVVDDEPDNIEFAKTVLEGADYTVISANDGVAGFETAKAEQPDLIILDVMMPKQDGFSTFNNLRNDEATKNIPVVMLTAVEEKTGIGFDAESMEQYMGSAPDGYADKPIDPKALVALVAGILAQV